MNKNGCKRRNLDIPQYFSFTNYKQQDHRLNV